jgi:hypothetical protein
MAVGNLVPPAGGLAGGLTTAGGAWWLAEHSYACAALVPAQPGIRGEKSAMAMGGDRDRGA